MELADRLEGLTVMAAGSLEAERLLVEAGGFVRKAAGDPPPVSPA